MTLCTIPAALLASPSPPSVPGVGGLLLPRHLDLHGRSCSPCGRLSRSTSHATSPGPICRQGDSQDSGGSRPAVNADCGGPVRRVARRGAASPCPAVLLRFEPHALGFKHARR